MSSLSYHLFSLFASSCLWPRGWWEWLGETGHSRPHEQAAGCCGCCIHSVGSSLQKWIWGNRPSLGTSLLHFPWGRLLAVSPQDQWWGGSSFIAISPTLWLGLWGEVPFKPTMPVHFHRICVAHDNSLLVPPWDKPASACSSQYSHGSLLSHQASRPDFKLLNQMLFPSFPQIPGDSGKALQVVLLKLFFGLDLW